MAVLCQWLGTDLELVTECSSSAFVCAPSGVAGAQEWPLCRAITAALCLMLKGLGSLRETKRLKLFIIVELNGSCALQAALAAVQMALL